VRKTTSPSTVPPTRRMAFLLLVSPKTTPGQNPSLARGFRAGESGADESTARLTSKSTYALAEAATALDWRSSPGLRDELADASHVALAVSEPGAASCSVEQTAVPFLAWLHA
jgi:hypothetical protein